MWVQLIGQPAEGVLVSEGNASMSSIVQPWGAGASGTDSMVIGAPFATFGRVCRSWPADRPHCAPSDES